MTRAIVRKEIAHKRGKCDMTRCEAKPGSWECDLCFADQILAIDALLIKDDDQSFPTIVFVPYMSQLQFGIKTQQDMLKQNWAKVLKDKGE